MSARPLAIALTGPTAAGKSDLALALAKHLDTEIISVDSALIYRGMDIGTAKPSDAERADVKHHLLDIRDPSEAYSAAEFARDAGALVGELCAQGKVPLLVGGTMLYFRALLEGLSPVPPTDPNVRVDVKALAQKEGWPAMHARLMQVDPETAQKLHPNHSQRIGRALEVFYQTERPLSTYQRIDGRGIKNGYRWIQIAIAPTDRSTLHQRIAKRFDVMLESGFLDEVEGLYRRDDLSLDLPSMRAVGYRQAWQHLDGTLSYDAMRDAGIAATRQLAKRQYTWLRSWCDLSWVYTDNPAGQMRKNEEILYYLLDMIGNTDA